MIRICTHTQTHTHTRACLDSCTLILQKSRQVFNVSVYCRRFSNNYMFTEPCKEQIYILYVSSVDVQLSDAIGPNVNVND